MALRLLVPGDDPILRQKSRDVVQFDERLHQLLDDMYDTMSSSDGVGLAAVQLGMLRRVVVIDIDDERIELINPVIIRASSELADMAEGCLSFPGEQGMVLRPSYVTVRAQDRYGSTFTIDGDDVLARAFCHEIDHLDGIIYQDKASRMLRKGEIPPEDRKARKKKRKPQRRR